MQNNIDEPIAVVYLARGAGDEWVVSCERFLDSYKANQPGAEHTLYVIFKGYATKADLEKARAIFSCIPHIPIFLNDDSFDIGAYIEWANMIDEKLICVFNTASEILAPDWLRKLALNLAILNVGLVGATASYESLAELNSSFPAFPSIHIRSTAFMIDRELFCSITNGLRISDKIDALNFESGRKCLTRQILDKGMKILLVGRNGRGYSPEFWAASDTFRQGMQKNLLVADNQTRNYMVHTWVEKRQVVISTWGKYIRDEEIFRSDYR